MRRQAHITLLLHIDRRKKLKKLLRLLGCMIAHLHTRSHAPHPPPPLSHTTSRPALGFSAVSAHPVGSPKASLPSPASLHPRRPQAKASSVKAHTNHKGVRLRAW